MDFKSLPPPPGSMSLCDLPIGPLSEAADETVRRARAFLFAVSQGGFWTKAVLQDYTESTHQIGVLHFSIATGERPFWEWREWRALRPLRDPDLPELVERLAAFRARWEERALESISVLTDDGDREEARSFIADDAEKPSRTWTAKALVQRLRGMKGDLVFDPVWSALVAQGFLEELPAFDQALADVQAFIRGAPLDEQELADMERRREKAASSLQAWLAEQKRALGPALNDEEVLLLGLGDLVPPPFERASAFLLQKIDITAKA